MQSIQNVAAGSLTDVEADAEEDRSKRVSLLIHMVVLGLVAAIYFHYDRGHYLRRGYPQNTFLFRPEDHGNDFFNIVRAIKNGQVYHSWTFVYFPFSYLALLPFSIFKSTISFPLFRLLFAGGAIRFVYSGIEFLKAGPRIGTAVLMVLLSYPFIFCMDRGNVEGLVFLFLVGFLGSFIRKKAFSSAFFLAAATAMKLYPGVFVILFLAARRFKEAVMASLLTIGLSFLSLLVIPGRMGENLNLLFERLEGFRAMYVAGDSGLRFSSGWYTPLKLVLRDLLEINPNQTSVRVAYFVFCLFCFAGVSWFVVFRERQLWKQVAVLTFSMLLFPHVSYDYKLVHLFLPLVLFLSNREKEPLSLTYTLLFGFLLIPKAYFWYEGDVNWAVFLNPLLMTLFSVLIFWESLRNRTRSVPSV